MEQQYAYPFVKWVGGKSRNLNKLFKYMPRHLPENYAELFAGSAAMYFAVGKCFKSCLINDLNDELMNAFEVVKNKPQELIAILKECIYDESFYYRVRWLDREPGLMELDEVTRAARFLYLNCTCFNGLYRVNVNNYFNVPFGRYTNPDVVREDRLLGSSGFMNAVPTKFFSTDYMTLINKIPANCFVYLDPPYEPVSATSFFTDYQPGGFAFDEQLKLKNFCDALNKKGVLFMLSNSTAPMILDLYKNYEVNTISASRSINSKVSGRISLTEVVVTNYKDFMPLDIGYKLDCRRHQEAVPNTAYTEEEARAAFKSAFGEKLDAIVPADLKKQRNVKRSRASSKKEAEQTLASAEGKAE